MEHIKPAYWAVIPASVRHDDELPPNAKLFYAEISALADARGYCWASNQFFAENYKMKITSVQRIIKTLADKGYITVVIDRDENTNAVLRRRIYIGINPAAELDPPHLQEEVTPSPPESGDPHLQKEVKNNYCFNIPPIVPQRGRRKRKEPREHPDWKPDRFEGFWKFYPQKGRKAKQSAMDAWDKLSPSDELIATIGLALVKQKRSDDWQRGIGIPYASTYLNQRRWEDADELPEPAAVQSTGWADDPEVI